jgi:hypothetical protein
VFPVLQLGAALLLLGAGLGKLLDPHLLRLHLIMALGSVGADSRWLLLGIYALAIAELALAAAIVQRHPSHLVSAALLSLGIISAAFAIYDMSRFHSGNGDCGCFGPLFHAGPLIRLVCGTFFAVVSTRLLWQSPEK